MPEVEKRRYPWHKFWIALGIVVAVVVGTGIFIASSDARIKSLLENKGSGKVGRALTIGDLAINWGWHYTHVHAADIHLANAPGLPEPDMVSIKDIDFDVATFKFIFGRHEIPNLTITAPELVFEKTDAKTKNWVLPMLSSGNTVANAVVPHNRHEFPVIGHLQVTDGNVIYRDHTKDLTLDLHLAAAQGGDAGAKGSGFTLTGDGTLSKNKFKVDASGGSLSSLQSKSKPFPLKADIIMGDTHVTLNGTFRDPVKMQGVDAALTIKGASLADLYDLTTIPFPPTPGYDLKGTLKRDADTWAFTIYQGRVGDSDLKGNGSYDTSGERGFFKAAFISNSLHVADLGGFIGYSPDTRQKLPSDKLFPDMPLNVQHLRASDMDVSLNAKKLEAPGWPLTSLDTHFDLKNGKLVIDPLNFGIAGGTGKGTIRVDAQPGHDMPTVDTDLLLRGMSMQQFFHGTRFAAMSGGHFGGRFQITGTGKSLADVLGSSNGRMSLLMGGGQISLLIIEAAGLDIAEATPLLLDKDKTTHVRCGIADFTDKNGFLYSDRFIFDTNDTKVEGHAQVDLKEQTIKAKMEAHPKDNSPLTVRTPLTLSGPLRHPSIGIDPKELGAKAGVAAALGAVLTPLASFIPFIDIGVDEDVNCRALIGEVKDKYDGAIPAPAASSVPTGTQAKK